MSRLKVGNQYDDDFSRETHKLALNMLELKLKDLMGIK